MRLYLDTSIFSAYHDTRTPERMEMTRDFWSQLEKHEKLCSDLTLEELREASSNLADRLIALTANFRIIEVDDQMKDLAQVYIAHFCRCKR